MKQLGSLRRAEIRMQWERKEKKKQLFFSVTGKHLSGKRLFTFSSQQTSFTATSCIKLRREKGGFLFCFLFFFFGPWCAQGRPLEINDLGAGKIILAIITTRHQWFSNASVRQSMLYKGHSLLFHLIWSLWQPQEAGTVSTTITILHVRILNCGGDRVLCAESQS